MSPIPDFPDLPRVPVPVTTTDYSDGGPVGGATARSFQDYLMVFRERWWHVLLVFLVVAGGATLYTLTRQPLYTSKATLEILRREALVMKVDQVQDSELRGPEDLNTQIKLLESGAIVQRVADRLTGDDGRRFLAPYSTTDSGDPVDAAGILAVNRATVPIRQSRMIEIRYTHPDAAMAARVANYFVEEFLNYNARWRADESNKAVDDLRIRAEQQSRKVKELGSALQDYKERNNMVSLDQRKDIVTEKLKALNFLVTQTSSEFQLSQVRWNQVQEYRDRSASLLELPFLSSQAPIQQLQQQLAAQKIAVSQLAQRYLPKHPRMQEALQSLQQTETELQSALTLAASNIGNEYEGARRRHEQARVDLAAQETETHKLDRLALDYLSFSNELTVNEQLHANIIARMRETAMSANIESSNARLVDRAGPANRPSSPNTKLGLALGGAGGLGLGLLLVLVCAYFDDRVRNAADIETVVGLPLIGSVPRIRKLDLAARSQIVVNDADPAAAEAFLSLHSNLRHQTESRRARVLLVTSTTPAEGKSFVVTNLSLAFASQGERTIIVDCDLRKPNVHASFGLPNHRGLAEYLAGQGKLEQFIVPHASGNLDVLTAGIPPRNPTKLLNNPRFAELIAELRQRYDRVFLDTPPLAPVSDAMILLRQCDGSLFTTLFNRVDRTDARHCVRRLLESGVPCYGAILNGMPAMGVNYRYSSYFERPPEPKAEPKLAPAGNQPVGA